MSAWLLCVLMCSCLDLSCLGLSVLRGHGSLFPFACWGSFQLLCLQISAQVLSPSLLLCCVCAWSLSCVQLSVTSWTVAHQAPLSIGILQARILEWVAMSSSRGSPHPGVKPWSPVLRQILYHLSHQGSPSGVSIMWIFVGLMLSQMSIMLSLFFFFILFSIFCFLYAEILCSIDFHHSVLQINYLFFGLSYSAIDSF